MSSSLVGFLGGSRGHWTEDDFYALRALGVYDDDHDEEGEANAPIPFAEARRSSAERFLQGEVECRVDLLDILQTPKFKNSNSKKKKMNFTPELPISKFSSFFRYFAIHYGRAIRLPNQLLTLHFQERI